MISYEGSPAMKNMYLNLSIIITVIYAILPVFSLTNAQSASVQSAKVDLYGSKMALMPFIAGQLESPDARSAKPLSKPLNQIVVDQGLPEGTDAIMNRLVSQALKRRYPDSMIPFDTVTRVYGEIMDDPMLDTTRKQAVRLGEMLQTDIVVVGTIWRFRQRGAGEVEYGAEGMSDRPASVGFALYLVDVQSGARLWRGFFDGTQKALTEDVLGGIKQIGMGLRWLTAEELAQYGVKSLLNKLSSELQAKPSAN
jgi:hypothetical protein